MPRELEWLPQSALDRMQADLIVHGEITKAQLAERVMQDAAPIAAYSIVDLAANSDDEAIRLKAAMYVMDRELGKPKTSTTLNVSTDNPVLQILEGVVVDRPRQTYDADPQSYYEDETGSTTVIDQEPTSARTARPRPSSFAPPFEETE